MEKNEIKLQDLEIGKIIWWTASRLGKQWSCPCLITDVNHGTHTFKLFCFDDMSFTNDLDMFHTARKTCCDDNDGLSILTEMTIPTLDEVIQFLHDSFKEHDDKIKTLNFKIDTINHKKSRVRDMINMIQSTSIDIKTMVNQL